MNWNKENLYNELININKKTGQGLSGIVRVLGENANQIGEILDSLVEDGLIECCTTGGSIGHPESNKFWMPTFGYNVWKDNGPEETYSKYKGRYLCHVRKFLGIYQSDDQFKMDQYFLTEEGKKDYDDWYNKNKEALELMKNAPAYDEQIRLSKSTQ